MKNVLISLCLITILTACSKQETPPQVPADLDAGRIFAGDNCAGCHGSNGRGIAPGIPHLAGQADRYLVDSLLAYREGLRSHAALRDIASDMSDIEIRDVAGFYSSLAPIQAVAYPDQAPKSRTAYEEGKLAAAACVECHGDAGNSSMTGIPSLAGQQPLYFIAATQAYLHGTRQKPGMGSMLRDLNKLDIERLALYYASQIPVEREIQAPELAKLGEPLTAQCGGCHGASGVSTDSATPNLAGQDPDYLSAAIKAYRGHTRQHDVMLADRSDEDINAIVAFYSSRTPKAAEDKPVTAKTLAEKCDRCHGSGVENPAMAIPRINGQDQAYLTMALRAYRDDRRGSSTMHKMSLPYSDALIEEVASLYAHRNPN